MSSYSFTKLSNYHHCPLMFRHYVDKTPSLDTTPLLEGRYVHKFAELYGKHCLDQNVDTDLDAVEQVARQALGYERAKAAKTRQPSISEATFEDLLTYTCHPFAHRHMFTANTMGVELRAAVKKAGEIFVECSFDDPDVFMRGVLDVIEATDDGMLIRDYKAGWSKEADKFQADVYAWMMFILWPTAAKVVVEFDFVRWNETDPHHYTRDEVPAIEHRILSQVGVLEADDQYLPTPGNHCSWCSYRHKCTAKPCNPIGVLNSEDDAKATLEAVALLERDLKDHKQALKDWSGVHGHIVHNRTDYGRHETGSDGFDDKRVMEFIKLCKENGIDPSAMIKVDNQKAKKLIHKGMSEDLAKLVVNKRKSQFKAKGIK